MRAIGACVDQIARLVGQRDVQADDVGACEQIVELQPLGAAPGGSSVEQDADRRPPTLMPSGSSARRSGAGDGAEADKAEPLAGDISRPIKAVRAARRPSATSAVAK